MITSRSQKVVGILMLRRNFVVVLALSFGQDCMDSWEDFVFHMTVFVFKARDGAFSDTLCL